MAQDYNCPHIELRFEDAMIQSPGNHYCKPQDRFNRVDGNVDETPCDCRDYNICPIALSYQQKN